MARSLTDPWTLGPLRVPNRVLLAPLAGIGNWFVRLQAKRYGAGMAVSEMVSSHAIHHRNERTCVEMLRIHPDEHGRAGGAGMGEGEQENARVAEPGTKAWPGGPGPVSIQLFGEDPQVMRAAAAHVARATSADAIDINMGCPVPKVRKTGAGVGLLADPDRALAVARAAREGVTEAGRELPVTVKLRSGLRPGDTQSGYALAHRLVEEAGVAAIAFHPRSAAVHHKGVPDYELAARLARSLPAPVILTGGLNDVASVRAAFELTGASAVMLARGALGNPWLFRALLRGEEQAPPTPAEVRAELDWTIERAVEHLGQPRATRYLRKFYPWYVERLGLERARARELCAALHRAEGLADVRALFQEAPAPRYTAALAAA